MVKCCPEYSSHMLRETVAFERKTRVSNGTGGFAETWATLSGAPTKAMVKAKSGFERYASDRNEARARYTFVVRYFAGLKEEDRITHKGRVYNIRFIDNVDFEDRWLKIDADGGSAT